MRRPAMARVLRPLAWTLTGLCVVAGASAQAPSAEPTTRSDRVYTRAQLTSTFDEGHDKPYVRLKLIPRAKIPFQIQTFRLNDRSLVAAIPVGATVEFLSERVDGTNTVTAIRQVPECRRFEVC